MSQYSLLVRTGQKSVDEILDTNLGGTIAATRAVGRVMMVNLRGSREEEGRHGPVIINVSSLLGLKGGVGTAVYAASKAGVLGMSSDF